MQPPTVITTEFEGKTLTILTWKGKPAWIASEVGAALGYAQRGGRLVTLITRDWSEEFIYGHDYVMVTGDELAALKAALEPATDAVGGRTAHLTLLLEPGLHLVLTKTGKTIGRRLRRFLVDEVLPRLARGQAVGPRPLVLVSPPAVPRLSWDHPDPAVLRERRLARQVDLADRKLRSNALRHASALLHSLGQIDDRERAFFESVAAHIALGGQLVQAARTLPAGWMTLDQVAEQIGAQPVDVLCAVMDLGLEGVQPGLSGLLLAPTEDHGGLASHAVLSPEAIERVRQHLERRRPEPQDAA